jgi:hypothetical protein
MRYAPVSALSTELVRFDTRSMAPEIAGVEYQTGTLAGYERREYLPDKRGRAVRLLRRERRAATERARPFTF